MNRTFVVTAVLALLYLCTAATADVFNMGPGLTNLEMVIVGDPGNAGELTGAGAGGFGPDGIVGSVSYIYRIGKFEVTSAQYCQFLNSKAKRDSYGLWNQAMADDHSPCGIQRTGSFGNYSYSVSSDWANRPVNHVGLFQACRFANWLNNGQGDGDTETGAYTLNGRTQLTSDWQIYRNPGAKWFIPSEDEWYKAAYYKGGGTNAGYWDYPTRTNSRPSNALINPDPGNNVNMCRWGGGYTYTIDAPYWQTPVGEFENSSSPYGTFDQGGNVSEWNDSIVPTGNGPYYYSMRGGSSHCYFVYDKDHLASARGSWGVSTTGGCWTGFRVAAAVPEPSSMLTLLCGIGCLGQVARRRRKLR